LASCAELRRLRFAARFLRTARSGGCAADGSVEFADRIKPSDAAITTYLDDLLASKYQIPTFQRDVVWDEDQVKRLWDSVFRFYPLGSILVWRTDSKLQKHCKIGGFPIELRY
jgi:hypothetical protein